MSQRIATASIAVMSWMMSIHILSPNLNQNYPRFFYQNFPYSGAQDWE